MVKRILTVTVSIICALIIVELFLHVITKPSEHSYGKLFNRELPPLKLFRSDHILSSVEEIDRLRDEWYEPIIKDGQKITYSDLYGIMRDDELLGYTIKENTRSTNGWRHSNDLGARSGQNTSEFKSDHRNRILFFGDSFTYGDRVKDNETFEYYLNEKGKHIEAINFGVGGYSMGQSYLRFRTLKEKLEFDSVFLVLVPGADIWREVNVSRYIAEGWSFMGAKIMPRFVIEDEQLSLVPSPYKSFIEQVNDNKYEIKPLLRDHMRKYDSFYNNCLYEADSIFDSFILYKIIKLHFCHRDNYQLQKLMMNKESEAVKTTKKIVDSMAREVESTGANFTLVILPDSNDITKYLENPAYKKSYIEVISYLCSGDITCYDLMDDFKQYPVEYLDTGYDGTHYGPKANDLIADFILNKINVQKHEETIK